MYKFTLNWFESSEIKNEIHKYINPDAINNILEIGSFEGAFSCYISNTFLDNDLSTLTCVDPFNESDTTSPVYKSIKTIFINNILLSKNWQKIRICQRSSDIFFKNNSHKYSFIYIDGSHLPEDIINDFNNSLKYIKQYGIIWMDDYGSSDIITNLIDSLYENNKEFIEIIHKGYQIGFKVNKNI